MKKILILACIISSVIYAQSVQIKLKKDSKIVIDSITSDSTIITNESTQTIESLFNIQPPDESKINYFTGPNGCINCTVDADTTFQLSWGVQNVASCSASNTANNSYFNGSVSPSNGGTGDYTKNIYGGISDNDSPVEFTLNCPAPAKYTNYNYKYLRQEVMEIVLPADARLMLFSFVDTITMLNIIEKKNKRKIINDESINIKEVAKNIFFGKVIVSSLNEINLKFNDSVSTKKKARLDQVQWLYISETDPRKEEPKPLNNSGFCDYLGYRQRLNLSTFNISHDKEYLKDTCSLIEDKTYYLVKVYLEN